MTDLKNKWATAQKKEAAYWREILEGGDKQKQYNDFEVSQQHVYKISMGFPPDFELVSGLYDLNNLSILDIGGGPNSLLLQSRNFSKGTVVDPLEVSSAVKERYEGLGIDLIQERGETFSSKNIYDEVWIYNCLQHVEDPEALLKNAKNLGKKVRIFEIVHQGTDELHLHTITPELIEGILGEPDIINHRRYYYKPSEEIFSTNNTTVYSSVFITDYRKKVYHLICPPTLKISDEMSYSPYVHIIKNMCKILKEDPNGELIVYGVEGSDVPHDKFINIVDTAEYDSRANGLSDLDMTLLSFYGYDGEYYQNAKEKILEGLYANLYDIKHDMILLSHSVMWDSVERFAKGGWPVIEYAVGYGKTKAPHCIFPSYTIQSALAGIRDKDIYNKINYYDFVIPHPSDHTVYGFGKDQGVEDYLLFLGRIQDSKGYQVLQELARISPYKIKVAGPLGKLNEKGFHELVDAGIFEYVGIVGETEKRALLKNATALLAPSKVHEIFHIAATEAMLSGVPVISSDAGAFSETIEHGKTGFRCNSLGDYEQAILNLKTLDKDYIKKYAYLNFSNDICKEKYYQAFNKIQDVYQGGGWYDRNTGYDIGLTGKNFDTDNALIIAAHCDDELIEHGNFLRSPANKNSTIVIVTSDGNEARQEESIAFAESLGLKKPIFLNHVDGKIEVEELFSDIENLISAFSPTIVATHTVFDERHDDHKKINRVVFSLQKKYGFSIRTVDNTSNNGLGEEALLWKIHAFYEFFKTQVGNVKWARVQDKMKSS